MAAAVELKFLAETDRKDRARNDAVELLTGTVDVGGAGPHGGELILVNERPQVEVARGSGGGVGRARVEGRALGDDAARAAVHFGRADVDVFFEPSAAAQRLVQAEVRHDVGLVPVLWVEPTLGDHALGSKVDNHRRGEGVEFD